MHLLTIAQMLQLFSQLCHSALRSSQWVILRRMVHGVVERAFSILIYCRRETSLVSRHTRAQDDPLFVRCGSTTGACGLEASQRQVRMSAQARKLLTCLGALIVALYAAALQDTCSKPSTPLRAGPERESALGNQPQMACGCRLFDSGIEHSVIGSDMPSWFSRFSDESTASGCRTAQLRRAGC